MSAFLTFCFYIPAKEGGEILHRGHLSLVASHAWRSGTIFIISM